MLQIKLHKLQEIETESPEKFKTYMDNMRNRLVRIYSEQHRVYWRENGSGYCLRASEAGLYTLELAYDFTRHCGREKQIQFNFLSKTETPTPQHHD